MTFNEPWVPVVSSAVKEVMYGDETKSIFVKFNRGAIYQYHDCTREEFDELTGAGSVGQYINDVLRAGHEYNEVVVP